MAHNLRLLFLSCSLLIFSHTAVAEVGQNKSLHDLQPEELRSASVPAPAPGPALSPAPGPAPSPGPAAGLAPSPAPGPALSPGPAAGLAPSPAPGPALSPRPAAGPISAPSPSPSTSPAPGPGGPVVDNEDDYSYTSPAPSGSDNSPSISTAPSGADDFSSISLAPSGLDDFSSISPAPSGLDDFPTTLDTSIKVDPKVKEICDSTDDPQLCLVTAVPLLNDKTDVASVLMVTMKVGAKLAKRGLSETKKLAEKTELSTLCMESFETTEVNYKAALSSALPKNDVATMNNMLSKATTAIADCEDAIVVSGEESPLSPIASKLTNMTNNCLSIISKLDQKE